MQKNTLEGKAKTKNGIKRLCFCAVCILLEVTFMVSMITRLNEYAEIVNLLTRLLEQSLHWHYMRQIRPHP